jgi:protein SCO1/2
MKGKVWVVSFFYSTCPFSCSRLNSNIKYLTTREELKDVAWVSITVDPATDTQEALSKYAKQLNADEQRWRFCRHDDFEYVKRLANDVLHVGGVNYQGHNDYVVVIDQNGEIKGMFNGYDPASLERAVEQIKELLANEPVADPHGEEAA